MSVTKVQLVGNVSTGASFAGMNVVGVLTATSFSGNGSGLTGVGLGTTGSINTSGIITATSIVVSAGTTALPSISPTGDTNTGIFFPSADTIAFSEGGAEAMRVDSSGRLLIGISTSGNANGGPLQLSGGITFPATAVAATNANTLDDYEEGTWTPIFGGTAGDPTCGYSAQVGTYRKIGSFITVFFKLQLSSVSGGSGNLLIRGLPFTVDSDVSECGGTVGLLDNFTNKTGYVVIQQAGTLTSLYVNKSSNNDAHPTSDLTNSTLFRGTVSYVV